jgi:hypothetical protein
MQMLKVFELNSLFSVTAIIKYETESGSQHRRNDPMTNAKVFATFSSPFRSFSSRDRIAPLAVGENFLCRKNNEENFKGGHITYHRNNFQVDQNVRRY